MLKQSSHLLAFSGLFTVSLLFIQPATAGNYELQQGTLHLTYESVSLRNNESLGLLGLHVLISTGKYSYLGVSGFGAVSGERGGFLTGGYTAGVRIPLDQQFTANLSLFLGGGGGGAAPQGGGLMVREQAGIDYHANQYQVGGGMSRIYFPNGEIDSTHPYLSLSFPFTTIHAPGWDAGELSPGDFPVTLYDRPSSIALSYKHYQGSSLFHSPIQPSRSFSTLGVEWKQYTHGGFYYSLSAHGAYAGNADGYAEIMVGSGYRWDFTQDTHFGIGMALGSGGGGKVDTGGGALGSITVNMEHELSRKLFVSVQGGYTKAMGGQFGGTVAGVVFGTHYTTPVTTGWEDNEALLPFSPARYRLRLIEQQYRCATRISDSAPSDAQRIDLTGLQLDMQMNNYFYLTGQVLEAWRGGAGGYASGMVGGGLSLQVSHNFALNGELLGGAAGGGGIDVGNGLLLGGTLSAIAHLTDTLDLEVGAGRIAAYGGGLDTRQLALAIAYRFTRPER